MKAVDLVKFIAIVHIFDGTQAHITGILRAIGAQFFGSISMFIGLCLIGMPASLALFFFTSLKIYGIIQFNFMYKNILIQ
jgi:Na+-driven multidrug efflux pump